MKLNYGSAFAPVNHEFIRMVIFLGIVTALSLFIAFVAGMPFPQRARREVRRFVAIGCFVVGFFYFLYHLTTITGA